jgi:hypothetical protein
MRRLFSRLVPLLLILPMSASLPRIRVHLKQLEQSGAGEGGVDTRSDVQNRKIAQHLPPRGRVGFLFARPQSSDDHARAHYFMNYSLAPRLVVPSEDDETMIAYGDEARRRLAQNPRFELVGEFGEGLSVFRRVR